MSGRANLDRHQSSVGARRKRLERACIALVEHRDQCPEEKHAPGILDAFVMLVRPMLPAKPRGNVDG